MVSIHIVPVFVYLIIRVISSRFRFKREIRTRYLSHAPGLRTCHPIKISNFEAHADMNIIVPLRKSGSIQ